MKKKTVTNKNNRVDRVPSRATQPKFNTVRLRGGPLHGRKVRVQRGAELSIPTRPKRGRDDRPPVARYTGDSTTGELRFAGIEGDGT